MSESFFLREISIDDVDSINKWRNDSELIKKLGSPFRYIDKSIDSLWLESYFKNRNNCTRLAICSTGNNELIGAIYLLNIDWISRSAELAIWIGNEKSRGKGAGYFAVTNTLNHAFNDLNLNRIYLTVLENNIPAIQLYKKVGFSKEGVHRNSVFKNGNYFNMIQMSILTEEYKLEN